MIILKNIRFAALLLCMALGVGNVAQAQKAPTGAINGKFSVSADKQVYFSKGNLQYQPSTKTWRFAAHQYDLINEDNAKAYSSPNFQGWMDQFVWGYGENPLKKDDWDRYPEHGFVDWGTNTISNGGNNNWRTLTIGEWKYVLFSRNTSSGIRFAKCRVNGTYGLMVFPDNWKASDYHLNCGYVNDANQAYGNWLSNQLSKEDWAKLEVKGVVFLPCHNGFCSESNNFVNWESQNRKGDYYWSSSEHNDFNGMILKIGDSDSVDPYYCTWDSKLAPHNVRLVCPVK